MDNSGKEDRETEGTSKPPYEGSGQTQPPIAPMPGPAKSELPPSPGSQNKPYDTNRDWFDHIKFGMEIIGLVVLIAYTTFAALQWRTNEKAANAADISARIADANLISFRETSRHSSTQFEESERAYVVVETLSLSAPLTVGHEVVVEGKITNTGKTPAIGVRIYYDLAFRRTPLPKRFPDIFPKKGASVVDLGASISHPLIMHTGGKGFTARLNENGLREITKGTYTIYAFGKITYSDIFGAKRETRFCGYYDPSGLTLGLTSCSNPGYNSLR